MMPTPRLAFLFLFSLYVNQHGCSVGAQDVSPFTGAATNSSGKLETQACGLIETTVSDPDWVMATSDRILRLNLCKASSPCAETQWYDSVFSPCYADNRFWKFPKDVETAFAYPLDALGVGSFDSLYVRRNVKLQFYSGTGDATPFGSQIVGPRYVSITVWRDIYVACNGFEPETFFVNGGPGALSVYSLKIGGVNSNMIIDINSKETVNEKDHHTTKYEDRFILRRGSYFHVELKLAKQYGPGSQEVLFEARHSFDTSTTLIDIPEYETPVPKELWGAERVKVVTNSDGTKTVQMKINIPSNIPIGEYLFKAIVRDRSMVQTTSAVEKEFLKPIMIVFNPWSTEDEVKLSSDSERKEYVMNENGITWRGSKSSNTPLSWRYEQFTKTSMEVLLKSLEGQPSTLRSDAKLVARFLSKFVNSQDDNGVLVGRWDTTYPGGVEPWVWSGSGQILRQYLSSGSVRYGQCWVFGGVLTTLLRCAGIPSRPVTNFNSAHDSDKPVDKIIDRYIKNDGSIDTSQSRDSIWNYHVWNDVWIGNEWHAVDATPQETSDGVYQLGPARHGAIKAKSGGMYDVDFVSAEVDASVRYWRKDAAGTYRLVSTDSTSVGHLISTKSVGGSSRNDITSSYKIPELRRLQGSMDNSPIQFYFYAPSEINAGSDILLKATLTGNSTVDVNINISIAISAISYDGTFLGSLSGLSNSIPLPKNTTRVLEHVVPPSAYLDWTDVTNSFQAVFTLDVVEPEYLAASIFTTNIIFPPLSLLVVPGGTLGVKSVGVVTCEFVNPLSVAINDVSIAFAVGDGATLSNRASVVEVTIGTISAFGSVLVSQNVTIVAEGFHGVSCTVKGDKVSDLSTSIIIEAFADCNDNRVPDSDDITSGTSNDCNSDTVPDECQMDCNDNGILDDCDIKDNTSNDCNANGIPDQCDIDSGTSLDENHNNAPDECDPDCNTNGIPDDLDILRCTSFDFNQNGVPDECDTDCNANGINDELDIAESRSLDTNLNGIPDECEAYCSFGPTQVPTRRPTKVQTTRPTTRPTKAPTKVPTTRRTKVPTKKPTNRQCTSGWFRCLLKKIRRAILGN
jgi:Transglutaminase-like superfamily/Transglutaminase family